MAKGESLDALLSPCLRVSRPIAACSRCRAAKIKCDGKLPACTACERSGKSSTCSGASDEFAKGKERSYVAALEAALERLQRRIAEAKALQATDPNRTDSIAATYMIGPLKAPSARRIASGGRVHRKEASDVDNLVGDFGFLSVNATSRDFHGFTATMSFARLLLSASKMGNISPVSATSLPPRYAITPLIQQYLDDIFVLMPFFSETDFMTSVSAVYAEVGRYAKAADHWIVRMVLAITAASCAQEKDDANYRLAHEHLSAAFRYAEDVLHPGSIAGLQAILLLVQYSLLDPGVFSSWQLIGFASRIMVDLGLHNEPAAEVRITKDELDMRRRVFHCVYAFDRRISMAAGLAFSFTDDSTSVELPVVHHSTIPSDPERRTGTQLFLRSLGPSLYLYDIRRVQSSLYQETHLSNRTQWPDSTASSYTKAILTDIRSWFSSIPGSFKTCHIVFFRLESLYTQIVALAPSCRILNMTELSKTLIFEYAIQYADQLHPVTRDSKWYPSFSITDASRVDFIGRQFRSAMWESFDHLICGAMPRESPLSSPESNEAASKSSSPPSPGIVRPTSGLENSTRAIRFLNRTIEILAYTHKRFGKPCASLHTDFEQESAVLLNRLKMKQQELGTVQYITGGPSGHQQQQQQEMHQTRPVPAEYLSTVAFPHMPTLNHSIHPALHQQQRPQTRLPPVDYNSTSRPPYLPPRAGPPDHGQHQHQHPQQQQQQQHHQHNQHHHQQQGHQHPHLLPTPGWPQGLPIPPPTPRGAYPLTSPHDYSRPPHDTLYQQNLLTRSRRELLPPAYFAKRGPLGYSGPTGPGQYQMLGSEGEGQRGMGMDVNGLHYSRTSVGVEDGEVGNGNENGEEEWGFDSSGGGGLGGR